MRDLLTGFNVGALAVVKNPSGRAASPHRTRPSLRARPPPSAEGTPLGADREEKGGHQTTYERPLYLSAHVSVGTRIVHLSGSWAAAPSATFNNVRSDTLGRPSCTLPYSQPPPRHGTTPRLHGGHGPAIFSTPRLNPTAPILPRAHRGPIRRRPARGAPPPATGRAAAP